VTRSPARCSIPLVLVLCSLLVTTAPAGAEDAKPLPPAERDEFLAALEAELSAVSSLKVHFRQERELAILTEPVVSQGVLAFVRPDRLHWEWTSPYPSLLVLNRGRVERFDVDRGELRRLRPAGEEMMRSIALQMTRWLQGRFRDASDLFNVEVMAGEESKIVLEPTTEGMGEVLISVEVVLGENPRVSRVVLRSPRDELTVMHYFNEQRDVELAEGLFDLSAPQLIGAADGE
jgi:outer membrane lipoprotein-sorting protein